MVYLLFVYLHAFSAGAWGLNFLSDSILKSYIISNRNRNGEKKLIHIYIKFGSVIGLVSSLGILVTGIGMTLMNPAYRFFNFSSNHWLATKQILMILLLFVLVGFIIPTSKKIRIGLGSDFESSSPISEEGYKNVQKLFKLNAIIYTIVLINFLLGLTHNFFA